jgi:hypothetical protein
MADSKEMLEATVKGLQEKVDSLTKDLAAKKNELEDINKPKISKSVYEEIEDSVYNNMEQALDRLDEHNYDIELELSGLELSVYQLNFHDTNSISEYIMDAINDKFNVVEDETTTDNS